MCIKSYICTSENDCEAIKTDLLVKQTTVQSVRSNSIRKESVTI